LTDSFPKNYQRLKFKLNIIHKAVGSITESDVVISFASDAVLLLFQCKAYAVMQKLIADNEEIDI